MKRFRHRLLHAFAAIVLCCAIAPVAAQPATGTTPDAVTARRLIDQAFGSPPRQAIPLYEKALALLEGSLGPGHGVLVEVLYGLAGAHQAVGEYPAALAYFQRSLAIDENNLGPGHPDIAIDLNIVAALHREMGDHASAPPLYQRSLAIAVLASRNALLHIASHFVFRPGTESDSYLLLGDGARLTLGQIKGDKLDFSALDLIALSACDTALGGGRTAQGQEVEGLGALVQRQGAAGVLATLWPVADESTAALMREFYRHREQEMLTKAEALRQAQLAFIGAATFAHPYYWAPFILMGNWL